MNRIVIAVLLGLIAIAAGVVWGIGQFGGSAAQMSAAREPIVREPSAVASAELTAPAQPATRRTAPAELAAPANPATTDESATAPPATPSAKIADPFRTTLDQTGQPATNDAPAAPVTDTPAAPVAPEPRVAPQQAGPATASVSQTPAASGLESQFRSRRVTYNRPPEKLVIDKAVDVSLVVNATNDAEAGKEALQGFPGTIVERDVDLSDTVSAQLTGVGFDITSQTVERQRLSGKTVNRWQWRVTPTEPGEHALILEIFGYATGSLDAEPLDAYRDVITVEVEQIGQLVTWAKGVQPLFAVLAALAGIGSALFAFLRFREEKKQTKAGHAKAE